MFYKNYNLEPIIYIIDEHPAIHNYLDKADEFLIVLQQEGYLDNE